MVSRTLTVVTTTATAPTLPTRSGPWTATNGMEVPTRGRIPASVLDQDKPPGAACGSS